MTSMALNWKYLNAQQGILISCGLDAESRQSETD